MPAGGPASFPVPARLRDAAVAGDPTPGVAAVPAGNPASGRPAVPVSDPASRLSPALAANPASDRAHSSASRPVAERGAGANGAAAGVSRGAPVRLGGQREPRASIPHAAGGPATRLPLALAGAGTAARGGGDSPPTRPPSPVRAPNPVGSAPRRAAVTVQRAQPTAGGGPTAAAQRNSAPGGATQPAHSAQAGSASAEPAKPADTGDSLPSSADRIRLIRDLDRRELDVLAFELWPAIRRHLNGDLLDGRMRGGSYRDGRR